MTHTQLWQMEWLYANPHGTHDHNADAMHTFGRPLACTTPSIRLYAVFTSSVGSLKAALVRNISYRECICSSLSLRWTYSGTDYMYDAWYRLVMRIHPEVRNHLPILTPVLRTFYMYRHALRFALMRRRSTKALCNSPRHRALWQQQWTHGRVSCSCTSLRQAYHAAHACWPEQATGALHAGCRRK